MDTRRPNQQPIETTPVKMASGLAGVLALLAGLTGTPVLAADHEIKPIDNLPAQAIQGLGKNSQFCLIMLSGQGVLGSRYDGTAMGSKEPGGQPGIANVTATNSSYRLVLDGPIGFSQMPPGGDSNVTFTTSYAGAGATNFSEIPGNTPVKLKKGDSRIQTNLQITRLAGAFPAGNYGAEITMRCE